MGAGIELPFTQSTALLIGVNSYSGGLPPLRTPTSDAADLAELLRTRLGFDTSILLDAAATRATILDGIRAIVGKLTESDRMLFYFAGHGFAYDLGDGPRGFLAPRDAMLGDHKSYLAMSDVYAELAAARCRHLLVILDCCFAGAFRWGSTRDVNMPPVCLYQQRFARYVERPARQLLVSADYDERARDEWAPGSRAEGAGRNSPFASTLLAGLRGAADASFEGAPRDGVITAAELYLYLRAALEPRFHGSELRQTPRLWSLAGHDRGEFVFLLDEPAPLPVAPPPDRSTNPYRGLEPYRAEHRRLFFGRDRVITQLTEQVTAQSFTVVTGPSGVGKSSVMQAGLLPRLQEAEPAWHVAGPVRLRLDPIRALLDACRGVPGFECRDEHELVSSVIAWCAGGDQRRLVIAIDQFEELVTLAPERARERATQILAELFERSHPRLRIVVTVRSDYEPHFAERFGAARWENGRFPIKPMSRDELEQVVERPAAESALELEHPADGPGLTQLIVDEVIYMPGGLPLLSFMLSELYLEYLQRHTEEGATARTLTLADRKKLGGVAGTLKRRADRVHAGLGEDERRSLRRLLVRMVATERGDMVRRPVELDDLAYGDEGESKRIRAVAELFVDARLLVRAGNVVEPAHDALLSGWPLVRECLDDVNFELRAKVAAAAQRWRHGGRATYDLWDRDPNLPRAREAQRDRLCFNRNEDEFLRQSARRRRVRITSLIGGISSAFVLIGVAALIALQQRDVARTEQQRTQARLLAATAERLASANDPRATVSAALVALESLRMLPSAEADAVLRSTAELLSITPQPWRDESWKRGYTVVGNGSGRIDVWLESNGSIAFDDGLGAKPVSIAPVDELAISPDGRRLAIVRGSQVRTYLDWRSRPTLERSYETNGVQHIRFAPSGNYFIVNGRDVEHLFDVRSTEEVKWFQMEQAAARIIVSPDDRWVASLEAVPPPRRKDTALADARDRNREGYRAHVWDMAAQQQVVFPEQDQVFAPVAFSPRREYIALGYIETDHVAMGVWTLEATPRKVFTQTEPYMKEDPARVALDPPWLAVGTMFGEVYVWNFDDRRLVLSAPTMTTAASEDMIEALDFSDQQLAVVTRAGAKADAERYLRLWKRDTDSDTWIERARGPLPPSQVIQLKAGWYHVWLRRDHTAGAFEIEGDGLWHDSSVGTDLAFAPDSRRLVIQRPRGDRPWLFEVRDTQTGRSSGPAIEVPPHAGVLAIAPDGESVSAHTADAVIRYSLRSGQRLGEFAVDQFDLASSADGTRAFLMKSYGDQVTVVDLTNLKELSKWSLGKRKRTVKSKVIEADRVVIGYDNGDVDVLTDTGQLITSIDGGGGFEAESMETALSGDGRVFARSDQRYLRLYRLLPHGAEPMATIDIPRGIANLTLNRRGTLVAAAVNTTADGPRPIRVWRTDTGALHASTAPRRGLRRIAMSPDDRYLAAASDSDVRVIPLRSDELVDLVCRRLPRNLTDNEWRVYVDVGPRRRTCPALP